MHQPSTQFANHFSVTLPSSLFQPTTQSVSHHAVVHQCSHQRVLQSTTQYANYHTLLRLTTHHILLTASTHCACNNDVLTHTNIMPNLPHIVPANTVLQPTTHPTTAHCVSHHRVPHPTTQCSNPPHIVSPTIERFKPPLGSLRECEPTHQNPSYESRKLAG